MAVDKKQVLMWVGGTLAAAGVSFLIYRLQSRDAAIGAANSEAASEAAAQQEQDEQAYLATQESTPVDSVSSTPTTATTSSDINTAVDNGGSTPSDSSQLESLISSFLANDNSAVTSQTSPSGNSAIAPITATGLNGPAAVINPPVNPPLVSAPASTSTGFTAASGKPPVLAGTGQ